MGMNRTERWERLDSSLRELWAEGVRLNTIARRLRVSFSSARRRAIALGLLKPKPWRAPTLTGEQDAEIRAAVLAGKETAHQVADRIDASRQQVQKRMSEIRRQAGIRLRPGTASPLSGRPANPEFAGVPQLPDRLAMLPHERMTEQDEAECDAILAQAKKEFWRRHLEARKGEPA